MTALFEDGSSDWLRLEIESVNELRSKSAGNLRATNSEVTEAEVSGHNDFPAREILERQFGGIEGEVTSFASRAVSSSEAAMREAWALRCLAERFVSENQLPPESLGLIRHMVHDHVSALRERIGEMCALLDGLNTPVVDPRFDIRETDSYEWKTAALAIFKEVEGAH